jgi:hypothetical protein
MFLGLLDPDPLVRGTDPDPSTCISSKNSKKNLDSYCQFAKTFIIVLSTATCATDPKFFFIILPK